MTAVALCCIAAASQVITKHHRKRQAAAMQRRASQVKRRLPCIVHCSMFTICHRTADRHNSYGHTPSSSSAVGTSPRHRPVCGMLFVACCNDLLLCQCRVAGHKTYASEAYAVRCMRSELDQPQELTAAPAGTFRPTAQPAAIVEPVLRMRLLLAVSCKQLPQQDASADAASDASAVGPGAGCLQRMPSCINSTSVQSACMCCTPSAPGACCWCCPACPAELARPVLSLQPLLAHCLLALLPCGTTKQPFSAVMSSNATHNDRYGLYCTPHCVLHCCES
jgi:hypothetical protein